MPPLWPGELARHEAQDRTTSKLALPRRQQAAALQTRLAEFTLSRAEGLATPSATGTQSLPLTPDFEVAKTLLPGSVRTVMVHRGRQDQAIERSAAPENEQFIAGF